MPPNASHLLEGKALIVHSQPGKKSVPDVGFSGSLLGLLEKEMATHPRMLTWEIPRTEEPGGLQSMELQKSQTRLSD